MREFGTFETQWAGELPRTETLEKIVKYFQREFSGLPNRQEVHRISHEVMRRQQKLRKNLSRLKPEQYEIARENAVRGMADLYNWLGNRYDIVTATQDLGPDAHFLSLMADNLEAKDRVVIDAACGPGIDLKALAGIFPEKLFIGYDISQVQIKRAHRRLSKSGCLNVKLFVADNPALPLRTESVDVIFIKYPDLETAILPQLDGITDSDGTPYLISRAVGDIRRVLRNDGALINLLVLSSPGGYSLPGFEYRGSVVWSDTPEYSGKPFQIAYFYRKSK